MALEPRPATAATTDLSARARALATQLAQSFSDQVKRSLGVELTYESVALAFADHQIQALADEDREPIVTLVAAAAGAWFGEFIRETVGGTWLGDGEDPRKLRLLLEPAFCHFSPVDLALEAIFVGEVPDGDPRAPAGAIVDGAFSLDPRPNPKGPAPSTDEVAPEVHADDADDAGQAAEQTPRTHDETSDKEWTAARLAELAPVEAETYYSLTGRYETLVLLLEMLAHRRVAEGKSPYRFGVADYLAALAPAAQT